MQPNTNLRLSACENGDEYVSFKIEHFLSDDRGLKKVYFFVGHPVSWVDT